MIFLYVDQKNKRAWNVLFRLLEERSHVMYVQKEMLLELKYLLPNEEEKVELQ